MLRKLGSVAFFVVVLAAIFWWKSSQETGVSAEYLQRTTEAYAAVCESEEERVYLTDLVALYHDEAFDPAYRSGRRFRSATMNEAGYFGTLHFEIDAHLKRDQATGLVERCRFAHEALMATADRNP
jgi:hypothetical protein